MSHRYSQTAVSAPLAGPSGAVLCPGVVPRLPGAEETSPVPGTGDAIRAAADQTTENEPWSDSALGVFFLGSLGMNVTSSSIEKLQSTHPCGADAGWFVSRETRRQWPARCKKLTCAYCLPREAAIRQLILAESMPDTMWSQTMVCDSADPDPWQVVRYKMNLFFKYYRRKAALREMSYVVEMNPQRTGYHVHALCHGPVWKVDILKDAQRQAHLGLHGNQWQPIGKAHDAAGYGLKGFSAAGYGLKGYTAHGDRLEALRINGGRLEHHTRGFIRVGGKPALLADARKAVMLKKYGPLTSDAVWKSTPVAQWWFDRAASSATVAPSQSLFDNL